MAMPPDVWWIERAAASARRVRPPLDHLELLPRHASMRRYARGHFGDHTEIALLPAVPDGPADEAGIAGDTFLPARAWLESLGCPVPRLWAQDEVDGVLWLEDVGTEDFDQWLRRTGTPAVPAYAPLLDVLVGFQRASQAHAADGSVPSFVTGRVFDRALLLWELEHYREWRLEVQLGLTLTPEQATALHQGFEALADAVDAIPRVPIHRDFQSHNLMVRPDGRVAVLDFQDAMMGSCVYDVVALLRDSYIELQPDDLATLVRQWATAVAGTEGVGGADVATLESWFALQTLQRKLKDAGRFVYIDRVKQNPSFLQHIPASLRYVRDVLPQLPAFEAFAELLRSLDPALRPTPSAP